MSTTLQIAMIAGCLILLAYVVYLVKGERLLLRYSMLWLVLAVVILCCALFPGPLFGVATLFGFETASNFVLLAGCLFLALIALSLSSIVSKQAISIKNLVQRLALLEKEVAEIRAGDSKETQSEGSR